MTQPSADDGREPQPEARDAGPRRPPFARPLALAGVVVAVAVLLAAGLMTRQGDGRAIESPPHGAGSPSSASSVASSAASASSASGASRPPLIAVVDGSGALTTMDEGGGSVVSYTAPGVVFGFPAWSPDGSRIAVVGTARDDTSIYVFTVPRAGPGSGTAPRSAGDPVIVYRSPDRPPFYLYWTPDGRKVAFLATESVGLSLRIAPADGSAPLDGSGPGAVVSRGAPLYFDQLGADRLLVHVGSGPGAFVGEVGPAGAPVARALPGTGDFRAASESRDGRYLAYARSTADPSGEIVIGSRDGSAEHAMTVFGPSAFVFDPTGDTLASIGADKSANDALSLPVGPLRLMDASSGSVRTLLDGSVVGFFWAPDGRTIAALRLVPPGEQTAGRDRAAGAAAPAVSAAPASPPAAPATTPTPGAAVRLAFVDVSTGAIRSERVVRLASHFVNELLPYFDQYALSHRLWSPDSTSILLPLVDTNGRNRLVALPADGTDGRPVADGTSGFWSP